jgi:hypothetical protein
LGYATTGGDGTDPITPSAGVAGVGLMLMIFGKYTTLEG